MSTSAGTGSPASLIAEARAGSPDALSALYLEHGAALFRLACGLVGAREDRRKRAMTRLLPQHLDDHPLLALPVPLTVEHPLPRA